MECLNIKDIEKAVKLLEKHQATPAYFYCSERTAESIIRKAEELGIKTKAIDGSNYILGMKIVTKPEIDDKHCYLSET